MARITASIVTYDTPLSELDSIVSSLGEADHVWIVDNASDLSTDIRCKSYGGRVEYIASANKGYGSGHNIAIRNAIEGNSDYHLVVNADVAFDPEMLREAVDYMEINNDIGLLHPRLVYPTGEDQMSVRLLPSPADLIVRRFLPRSFFRNRLERYELRTLSRSHDSEVAYVQGSFMLFRTDALRDTGLFDERFFMYPEDIDISRRMAAGGRWRVVYAPRFRAVHRHAAASYHSLRMLRIHIVNMIRYFNKWGWFADDFRRESNRAVLSQI